MKKNKNMAQTESYLRELLDHMINGVVVYEALDKGHDFIFKDANTAAQKMEGISKDKIIGKSLLTVFPFLKGSEILSVIKNVWETGIPGRCLVKLIPDGKLFGWRDFYVYKLHTGELVSIYEDVTGKKQKEADQERLISILEATSDLVSTSDLEGNIAYRNQAGQIILGFDDTREKGKKIKDAHPEWAYQIVETHGIPAAIENGIWKGETAIKNRNGKEIPVSQVIMSHKSQMGTVDYLSTIIRDISEQKKVEKTLKRSEEKFSQSNALLNSLIDSIPDLIFYKDNSGTYMGSNMAFSKFVGRGIKEIVGLTDYDLFDKPLAEFFRQKDIEMLSEGKPKRNEEWVTYPDGTLVLLDTLKTPYFGPDKKILGLIGISRDITLYKRTEQQLIRQASAIENAAEEICITDTQGIIEYVNPAFEKITGYSSDEVLGQNPRILKSGKHDEAFYKNLWETILAGKVWSGQITNKSKSGTFVDMECTISPIFDERHTIIGFVSVKRDVTENLRMERQIRESQKHEAIGTLASGIAHDFNNILTAILGYTDLAMMTLAEDDNVFEDLLEVKNAGNRAKELVGQILTFCRLSEKELAPHNIHPVVTEAVKLLRASLPSTIDIKQKIDKNVSPIMANPTQIHQVIMNLCTNSFHAMKNTGGNLTITLDDVMVQDTFDTMTGDILAPGNYVKLAVTDSGTGMAPEIVQRIFEPYFTTKEKGEGTGLGLAVVHGIVNDHRGHIEVESSPGKGTSIEIYFPAIEFKGGSLKKVKESAPQGNENILLIDDEIKILDIGKRNFEKLGYTVHAFRNSSHAIHFFKNHPNEIDIVITDVTMPQKTGMDVAKEVLKLKPNMPIIMCTGFTNIISSEEAKAQGVRVYMMKPLEYNELAVIIRNLLDTKNDI